jgi:hypothetical protein
MVTALEKGVSRSAACEPSRIPRAHNAGAGPPSSGKRRVEEQDHRDHVDASDETDDHYRRERRGD